jgi:hypothetical protein
LKTDDDLNQLATFVKQFLSKPHLDASESADNSFFVTKGENFDKKNVLLYRKRSKIKHFRSGRSKFPV